MLNKKIIILILISLLIISTVSAVEIKQKQSLFQKLSSLIHRSSSEQIQPQTAIKIKCIDSDALDYNNKGYATQYGKKEYDQCMLQSPVQFNSRLGQNGMQTSVNRLNLGIGEHNGFYQTLLVEKTCGVDLKGMQNIIDNNYDCTKQDKSCGAGACFKPECSQIGNGVRYTGLELNGNKAEKTTKQIIAKCKNENSLIEYQCGIQPRYPEKFKILDPKTFGSKYIINPGQKSLTSTERRCGSATVSCPVIEGVLDASIEMSGCLDMGDVNICADDLNDLTEAERDRMCNPPDSSNGHYGRHNNGDNPIGNNNQGEDSGTTTTTTGITTCSMDSNGNVVVKDSQGNILETHQNKCVHNNEEVREWECFGSIADYTDKECGTKSCENGACIV